MYDHVGFLEHTHQQSYWWAKGYKVIDAPCNCTILPPDPEGDLERAKMWGAGNWTDEWYRKVFGEDKPPKR